jgi:FkbM family methyltransferase
MAFGLYEVSLVRLLKKLLEPGDHVIDAGANIGYISLIAAQLVGSDGRVDAFEPAKQNRKRLQHHIDRAGLQQAVHVHSQALSDQVGSTTIHFFGDSGGGGNHGSTSIFRGESEPTDCYQVQTLPLDDHLDGREPKLIKIDVEGAEPLVVTGMKNCLLSNRPPVVVGEINPKQSQAAGFDADEWVRRLLQINSKYQIQEIGRKLKQLDLKAINELGQTNVVLTPRCYERVRKAPVSPIDQYDTDVLPSDLTDEQWALIEPLIPKPLPGGRPRSLDMRQVVNAILYLNRSGNAWRIMPRNFGPWSNVYH